MPTQSWLVCCCTETGQNDYYVPPLAINSCMHACMQIQVTGLRHRAHHVRLLKVAPLVLLQL